MLSQASDVIDLRVRRASTRAVPRSITDRWRYQSEVCQWGNRGLVLYEMVLVSLLVSAHGCERSSLPGEKWTSCQLCIRWVLDASPPKRLPIFIWKPWSSTPMWGHIFTTEGANSLGMGCYITDQSLTSGRGELAPETTPEIFFLLEYCL